MGHCTKATLLFLFLLRGTLLTASTFNWAGATANWNAAPSWTQGVSFPNSASDQAIFGTTAAPNTVTVTAPVTVGTVTLDSPFAYTITGSTVTFGSASIPGIITVTTQSGGHTFASDITLANTLTITQDSTGPLTLSGTIGESGGNQALSIGGSQMVIIPSNVSTDASSYAGGTTISSGTLRVSADGAGTTPLGALTGVVTIAAGTFQAGASFGTDATRGFTLTGAANFDSNGNTLTINGVIGGSGSLNKVGTGVLVLAGANTYEGGTTITTGTLQIASDANLGLSTAPLSILNGGILHATGSFNSARSITLTSATTLNAAASSTLSGVIQGAGSLTLTGAGPVILTGANTYSLGTTISAGTLQGNSTSLQGSIVDNSALVFNQTTTGTYAGALSGTGTLTVQGGGNLTMSGNSSGLSGAAHVTSSTQLTMTGNLSGSSLLTIDAGSILSGNGTVGATSTSGHIVPTSLDTLTVSGNLTFVGGSSALSVEISPSANSEVVVSGMATLTPAAVIVTPQSEFYGLSAVSYTILTANTRGGTTFNSLLMTDSNFSGTLSYPDIHTVLLTVRSLRPFQGFAFGNDNERAVGNNIDDISSAGSASPDFAFVIDALAGQDTAAINDALDQMHPAAMSALAEVQSELGGQLLSLFHRRPTPLCSCSGEDRLWIEPYGNWLKEKHEGEEIGFDVTSKGIAFGYDREFLDCWTIGIGGAWNSSDLDWSLDRGYAYIEGLYGAFYTDVVLGNFYFGGSVYGGVDWYDTSRGIHFTTIDRQATAHYKGIDVAGQFTAAYIFGAPVCLFYPYGTVDYLYLHNESYTESGADSLDLNVQSYTSSTLRSEVGVALTFSDKNYKETLCIAPLLSIGWVMEWPIHRDDYTATFAGETIPFTVKGWDKTWQLLNCRFGLGITYRCFSLDSQYVLDISPSSSSLCNQRANFRFSYSF